MSGMLLAVSSRSGHRGTWGRQKTLTQGDMGEARNADTGGHGGGKKR